MNKSKCIFPFSGSIVLNIILLINVHATLFAQPDFSRASVLKRLSDDELVLTADSLRGREAGTIYEIKARNYIAGRFKEIGLKPAIGDTSYYQKFYRKDVKRTFNNVCGFLDNKASKTIVIGAHYDHLGMGNFGSRYGPGKIHHGADDNASGVVAMMEMARFLSSKLHNHYNYMFVAFTGEEMGLYGSDFFIKSDISKKVNITYMINFDMVGRYNYDNKNRIILFGTGSSPMWRKILRKDKPVLFKLKKIKYGPPFSDHISFYNNGVPILYFTTGTPLEYHTPSDEYQTINFEGMTDILDYVEKLTQDIDKSDKIPFRESNKIEILNAYIFSLFEMP